MDASGSPEDNTCVVRIMGELQDFLTRPGRHPLRSTRARSRPEANLFVKDTTSMKLDFDSSEATQTVVGNISGPPSRLKRDRDIEAQLLSAKAKIARLEVELTSAETEQKRAKIESEQDNVVKQKELQKREEKFDEVQKRLRYMADSEEAAKEELADIKKQFEALKEKYNREVQNYQREQLKLSSKLDEVFTTFDTFTLWPEDEGSSHIPSLYAISGK